VAKSPGGSPKELGGGTRVVVAGRQREWTQGIVNTPVWRASTVLFDTVDDLRSSQPPIHGRLDYCRNGSPTTWSLCDAITGLEPGAAGTRLFPSGLAAISATLLAFLQPTDELLMVDTVYPKIRLLCDELLAQKGIRTRYYDPGIGPKIDRLFSPATRLIYLESPGSLTLEVQDVPAICRVARASGITTILDNSWATPLLFPAMAAGVDVSIIAGTKCLAGHGDAVIGLATASVSAWEQLDRAAMLLGQNAGPDEAWLASRGLRTLDVRLSRQGESGLRVARWLSRHPSVERVLHPGLPEFPSHELWQRDFRGACGLFAFILRGGDDKACARLVDRLDLFGIGLSWGSFESLALPVDPAQLRSATTWSAAGPLVRLHIGLEDPEDLIADLDRALAIYPD